MTKKKNHKGYFVLILFSSLVARFAYFKEKKIKQKNMG